MEIRHGNIDLTPIQEQINTTNENLTNINENINQTNEKLDEINENLTNGSFSGDFITPEIDIENPGEAFYQNFYNHLINGLTYNGNVSIVVKLPTDNGFIDYTINSSDMAWSVPELDDFINIIWWLAFGYSFFKVVYKLYEKVSTGNLESITEEVQKDKDVL